MGNYSYTGNAVLIVLCMVIGLIAGAAAERVARRRLPELHRNYVKSDGVAVAITSAVLFGAVAWRFGLSWMLPAFLFLAVAGTVLSRIDLRHRLLPNALVFPAFLAGSILLAVAAAAQGGWANLLLAAIGAVTMFTIYLVLAIISPRGLGMGDVKFSGVLGFYLGYLSMGSLVLGMFLGFVGGAVTGGVLVIAGFAGRKTAVPFGPSMFAGAMLTILFGEQLGRLLLPSMFP